MNYFPFFAELKNRPVLVVGGGSVALRKIEALLKANASIKVVAERLNSAVQNLKDLGKIEHIASHFAEEQLDRVYLVIAATDDVGLNKRIFNAAEQRCRLVNVVDEQEHCNFIFPSIIDRSPVQIAISSGGTAPVLIRLLREKLEALLPKNIGTMATIAQRFRSQVKQRFPHITQRRRFWEQLFQSADFQRLTDNQQIQPAETLLQQSLSRELTRVGEVSLVGAGPGDSGLLTLKGLQRIQQADIVLYDALVSEQVLDLVRRDAEKISVGKRAGSHSVQQEETNRLLVKYAKQGKRVVRLKGGDPFVFGRGGEELEVLKAENIPFEVVPGITAALGATAYAGIPLTHRNYAQTTMFITGHTKPDGKNLTWQTLAQGNQTLAVYMGTIKAADLAENLQIHGRSPDTPVAVISHGTLPTQQIFAGKLADLAKLAEHAPSPALIVIGETVALQPELAWFGQQAQQFVGSATAFKLDDIVALPPEKLAA
ncbi:MULTISPECIES: siroheme synthase CysG [unclassified Lonepinella]|uniref:siroheme synthase CysG n=1 Tax=unclassified Lonepinella TaxID=2642006 RepID=UPI0036D994AE